MRKIRDWIKSHERQLWWGFLVASIAFGIVRNPSCSSDIPWWMWVVPTAAIVIVMAPASWGMYRLSRDREAYIAQHKSESEMRHDALQEAADFLEDRADGTFIGSLQSASWAIRKDLLHEDVPEADEYR